MIYNKKSKNKKMVLIACIVALALAGGGLLYRYYASGNRDKWEGGVNYRPPTKEEQSAGDEKKKEIVEKQEQQSQQDQSTQHSPGSTTDTNTAKNTVSVAITDAEQYGATVEVRSFVPDYSQDGTCTLTLTQGTHSFTRTTPAYKDVSSTVCPSVKVKVSDFPSGGQWQVVVSFESTNAKGQSDPRTFTITK